jgi:hypothetical protein
MIHLRQAQGRMPRLQAGALYFVICFTVGFIVDPLRELWLDPLLGQPRALAIELILLLLVSAAAARTAIRQVGTPMGSADRIGVGLIALLLLVLVEDGLARLFTDTSFLGIWAQLSDEAQVMSALLMLLYAAMPLLTSRPAPAAPPMCE